MKLPAELGHTTSSQNEVHANYGLLNSDGSPCQKKRINTVNYKTVY